MSKILTEFLSCEISRYGKHVFAPIKDFSLIILINSFQEIKEYKAMLMKEDTVPQMRDYWTNELSKCMREIREEYDNQLNLLSADLESKYQVQVRIFLYLSSNLKKKKMAQLLVSEDARLLGRLGNPF